MDVALIFFPLSSNRIKILEYHRQDVCIWGIWYVVCVV